MNEPQQPIVNTLSSLTEAFDLELIGKDPALKKLYKEYLKVKIEGQKQGALMFYKDLKEKSNEVKQQPKKEADLKPDEF